MRHLLLILASILTPAAQAAVAQDRCYEWTDAAPIVQRENLMSSKDLHDETRKRLQSELVRVSLCEEKGQFVYKLVLMEGSGRLKYITVSARQPF